MSNHPERRFARLVGTFTLFGMLLLALVTPIPSVGAAPGGPAVEVKPAEHHDVSPPLRDIPPAATPAQSSTPRALPLRPRPNTPAASPANATDKALQPGTSEPKVGTTPGFNFDGLTAANACNCAPPDTEGAVGATQYVQWVNIKFAVYNKSTSTLVMGPVAGNTLWTGFADTDCATNNDGDPIVLYDKIAGRWFFTQFSVTTGTTNGFKECVAVSTSSDATGKYYRYAFPYTTNEFNDYPKAGVWPDAYYLTYNVYNGAGTAFLYAKMCAFDRANMLVGNAATQQCSNRATASGVLPSDFDGTNLPPAGSPNYMLELGEANNSSLDLLKFHVDWVNPANTTLSTPVNIPVTAFSLLCTDGFSPCITQPSPGELLDTLGDRLMYRLAYRNFGDHEALVVNHSVSVGGVSGVRWYEIRNPNGTPTVFQQSTYQPDTKHRWMGSVAMDHAGNMALGFDESNSSTFPSVAYTGRLATDTLNTMESELVLMAGGGAQTSTQHRWGDYSAMSVDPLDDCTFWYTNEYYKVTGTFAWDTRIASFKFPSCSAVATPPMPVGLRVAGQTTNSVTFTWAESDPTASVAAYDGSVHILSPGTTSYTVTGVPNGSYACLAVISYNGGATYGYTGYACGFVVPLTPMNVHVTSVTTSVVNFIWTNGDTTSYEAAFDGTTTHLLGPNATTYAAPTAAGMYSCITVVAYYIFSSLYSPWACGFAIPAMPTSVHTTGHTQNSVSFAWTDSDPFSGIVLTNDGVHLITLSTHQTTYTQSGMVPGQISCISLAAYNASGASPYTAYVCGTAG